MEGTQPDAAATRKRRSSILKSQRAPRTPFSELEFDVATPTDTGKSRRVSFSRRTGVAEFATNEATTTWKNFYEEQNKSLESSGHDSGAKAARPSIGHLGNRIFDQQFQDIEIDFSETIDVPQSLNINSSLNDKVEEELALLECAGDDKKLAAPQNKFELSMFTENHSSKMFADNLTTPAMGEMTDRIDINFSAVQSIGNHDDLDDIEKDFLQPKVVCAGPSGELSEYIEIDFNMTQGHIKYNNESDMSITDNIRSPKLELSKNSISFPDLKRATSKDWIEDKENIVVNPYVAPDEEDNFAINEAPEKVLVFTGKKLKYADIDADLDEIEEQEKKMLKKSLMSEKSAFINNTLVYNTSVSMTRAVPAVVQNTKRQTIVFDRDDADADISMTQCVPGKNDRTQMPANDDLADMSITQAVSKDMLHPSKSDVTKYSEDMDDMSFTKAVPVRVESKENIEKMQTIVFEADNAEADIPVTQCDSDVMVRQIGSDKTLVFKQDDNTADISVTQAVPNGILVELLDLSHEDDLAAPRRQTVHIQDANLSMARATPSDLAALINKSKGNNTLDELAAEFDVKETTVKRKTIVFDTDDADMSMTQAIPQLIQKSKRETIDTAEVANSKRRTIVFDDADMSMTQAVPKVISTEIESDNKRKTILFDQEEGDISMTQVKPAKILTDYKSGLNETHVKLLENTLLEKSAVFPLSFIPETPDILVYQAMSAAMSQHHETDDHVNTKAVSPKSSNRILNNQSTAETSQKTSKHSVATVETQLSEMTEHRASIAITTESFPSNVVVDSAPKDNPVYRDFYRASASDLSVVIKDTSPSSKGDEFHASSMKLNADPDTVVAELKNPRFSHSHKAPRVGAKRLAPLGEPIGEEAIKSLCYDEMVTSSTNIEDGVLSEEPASNSVAQDTNRSKEKSDGTVTNIGRDLTGKNDQTSRDVSNSPSLLHSLLNMTDPVTEKCVDKLITAKRSLDSDSDKIAGKTNSSSAGSDEKCIDKLITARRSLDSESDKIAGKTKSPSAGSADSMFLIIKDSEDDVKIETVQKKESFVLKDTRKSIKFSDEVNSENVDSKEASDRKKMEQKENNFTMLQNISRDICRFSNKMDMSNQNVDAEDSGPVMTNINRTFKDADNTAELLEMLSKYTDKSIRRHDVDYDKTIDAIVSDEGGFKCDSLHEAIQTKEDIKTVETNTYTKPTRVARVSNDSISDSAIQSGGKKPIRISNDVIKTLKFDESGTDVISDSLLKKTAFAETEYTREKIGNVIPNFDVSEGVKELMKDLVQPNADQPMSFNKKSEISTRIVHKPSTCSTQAQANLEVSSQVDIPNADSSSDQSLSSKNRFTESDVDRPDRGTDSSNIHRPKSIIKSSVKTPQKHKTQVACFPESHRVVVFDHSNPLNNVLLAPIDFSDAHRYNPDKPGRSPSTRFEGKEQTINTASIVEKGSYTLDSGDSEVMVAERSKTNKSRVTELKDTEVNTVLSMKGTQELLDASSSLTLVDNAFSSDNLSTTEVSTKPHGPSMRHSPIEVIYSIIESANKTDTDNTRKHIFSPDHRTPRVQGTISELDVTPKQASKQKKLSFSPVLRQCDPTPTKRSRKVSPKKSPVMKQTITMQQLLTQCQPKAEEPSTLNRQLISALQGRSAVSSATTVSTVGDPSNFISSSCSSNQEIGQDSDGSEPMSICVRSKAFNATRSDWQPELLNEISSKNLVAACDSSVNVVGKINLLPFMGSRDCEWDSAGSDADTWSFHLLHSRVRVVLRLAPRAGYSTREYVRFDTPVESATVEPVRRDQRNTVGSWAVQFAVASMRNKLADCSRAGAVPGALRKCTGVAQVALRWARAMHDAKMRLAYTLCGDTLTLKVANIPRRAVWQVWLQVQFVDCAPRCVHIDSVALLDGVSQLPQLRREASGLQHDWGHVPKTLWKVFKYLKYLQKDEGQV